MALAMFFMPESPYFLVTVSRDEDALKSLKWLRGENYNAEGELEELKKTHKEQQQTGAISIKELLTKVKLRNSVVGECVTSRVCLSPHSPPTPVKLEA